MRTRSWWALVMLATAGALSCPAQADISWSGAGWYVEALSGFFDFELISGPYASEEACKTALPADTEDTSYMCSDEEQDPSQTPP